MVEQPEPSISGDWYYVPLDALINEGYQVVGVHFPDGSEQPNVVEFVREQEASNG